jgi:acetoin utilization deacetylase AcuC-like enzyme
MPVGVFTHPACLLHDPGPGHPEAPARLRAILDLLSSHPAATITTVGAAEPDALAAVHPPAYLTRLERVSRAGGGMLDADTVLNDRSWDAVLGATGAVLAAVEYAHAGRGHAFAAVRPPGHHALADTAMGFCLVNNAVVASRRLQALGSGQVLIVDWDVHHGNGTQAIVERDASIRYVSIHQFPWYPGTGLASERGVGNVFNVPRPPGLPARQYVADLWEAIELAGTGWAPDALVISAGFDTMAGDPLGGFTLEPTHYGELTHRLRDRFPICPIVGTLEGGYNPSRLADGVLAHVAALG